MTIGIIGLGLIGGSLAKALHSYTDHTVWGTDHDPAICQSALSQGVIHKELSPDDLSLCDLLIFALYPQAVIDTIRTHLNNGMLKKDMLVMDVCGVKSYVCDTLFPLAYQHKFCFIGTHPMAGTERSGLEAARPDLFQNAWMILTPAPQELAHPRQEEALKQIESICSQIGFGGVQYTTPKMHDRLIAYTSQLAHAVSAAYVLSPTAQQHLGFSAGSFRDMTRVAKLNEAMWSELFLENPDALCDEIDSFAQRLSDISTLIREGRREQLMQLLRESRLRKEALTQAEEQSRLRKRTLH